MIFRGHNAWFGVDLAGIGSLGCADSEKIGTYVLVHRFCSILVDGENR